MTASRGEAVTNGQTPKLSFRGFLLLLVLAESPAHGYELIERLGALGVQPRQPATAYKLLRRLEEEQLVTSAHKLSAQGPPQRIYSLTSAGRADLEQWIAIIKKSHDTLNRALRRYRRLSVTDP